MIYNLYICVLLINASQLIYLYYMSANKLDIGIGDDEVVSSDVAKGGGTMHDREAGPGWPDEGSNYWTLLRHTLCQQLTGAYYCTQ